MLLIILFQLFIVKHFVVDFVLQPPFMYLNKGNIKHYGGYVHAGFHAAVSYIILFFFLSFSGYANLIIEPLVYLIIFEFVTHYFIDYLKVNINNIFKWQCNTSKNYWILMGFDQLLHYQVYVIMILILWGAMNV